MPTTAEKIAALRTAAAASTAYAEIVPLFTSLYGYINGRERETGISLTLDGINAADRLGNGFPLVSPLDLHVDHHQAVTFLTGVIDVLATASREGHQELARFRAALHRGAIDPRRLFSAILERRRAPLDEAAAAAAVPAPLVEYLLEIPLRTALELAASTMAEDAFADWDEGSCPFCGSRAGMAELVGDEGRRYLACGTCSARWAFKRLKCPYCGSEDSDQLAYFTAEDGPCRVDTCRACSRYIKTRDTRQGHGQVPLEVEDLLTIHLDLLATREGFERGK